MTYTCIDLSVSTDFVAVVTINHPPVNAYSQNVLVEIAQVFDEISDRPDIRAVVLTGQGKTFCAGADIKERKASSGDAGEHWQNSRRARGTFYSIMECKKPVIAAINGPALGGGLAIAASCDILLASDQGCLGLPEINVGLAGGARHCQRLFSHSTLRRMVFTGKRVYGPELYRLGIIEELTSAESLMNTAIELAREIAQKSPLAVDLAKHSLNQVENMTLRDGYRFEQSITGQLMKSADSKEAMAAFAEKRAPVFKGC